jgi:hypothetical protein
VYPIAMPSHGGKSLAPDVQAKVTELVREFITEVGGQAAAAKALGISQGYLSEFLSGGRGGGGKLLRGLAKHRPEVVELMMTGVSRTTTTLDPRYPNRAQAIKHLVDDGAGTLAEVETAADAYAVALKSDSDPTVLEWVRNIEGKLRELRRGGPRLVEVPVTSIGDEGIGNRFSAIGERKKKGN